MRRKQASTAFDHQELRTWKCSHSRSTWQTLAHIRSPRTLKTSAGTQRQHKNGAQHNKTTTDGETSSRANTTRTTRNCQRDEISFKRKHVSRSLFTSCSGPERNNLAKVRSESIPPGISPTPPVDQLRPSVAVPDDPSSNLVLLVQADPEGIDKRLLRVNGLAAGQSIRRACSNRRRDTCRGTMRGAPCEQPGRTGLRG